MSCSYEKYCMCSLIIIFFIGCMSWNFTMLHSIEAKELTNSEAKGLVIYSSNNGEIDEHQRSLDLLMGHFTTDITFKSSQEVKKEDLSKVTHLFYYGQVSEKLPYSFTTIFDDYEGYFTAIGYNTEQLGDHFSFIEPMHEKVVSELSFTLGQDKSWQMTPDYVIEIEAKDDVEVLVEGKDPMTKEIYPVAVKKDKHYYIGMENLYTETQLMLGEVFHQLFNTKHVRKRPVYIRLEDIHPLVDPKNVQQIVDILYEKNIPFMMAVIPVYTNPETGEQFHFSDAPKLLKVLKNAQKKGGSVVLHGYTHQFRQSETGEGFEFWDVENNRPIYAEADETFTLREREDFKTSNAYEQYLEAFTLFETNYIEEKVTRGIQELTNYGLYPLAFEAPHYTMSQNGYRILANYFSTYVGQVQLSDADWEIMDATPYRTTPHFLHGMELLPETLGYVMPEEANAIEQMMERANHYLQADDAMLAGFYHPYLGVDQFLILIEEMASLENIAWIDLQKEQVWTKAENVYLYTDNGEIIADVQRRKLLQSSFEYPLYHVHRFLHGIFWAIASIGGGANLVFVIFICYFTSRKIHMEG